VASATDIRLPVLDDDAFDHVGDVLAAVGHAFELVEQVLQLKRKAMAGERLAKNV
jgi:hypothetical protein